MYQILHDDSSFEPSDRTVLLAEVVALIGKKDSQSREQAFNLLYAYYQQPIKRYFRVTWGHDLEQAADLCQETFTRVWRCFQRQDKILLQIDSVNYLRRWIYRIAKSVAIDDLRRKKPIGYLPTSDSEAYPQSAELTVEGHEGRICDIDQFQEALAQLPLDCREPLLLKYQYGYSQKQIATEKSISEAAVSVNVSRGKEQLYRKYFPVTIDLQLAEALHVRDAIYNIISGVKGAIDVGKIDEYEVKARDRRYREYMRKHTSELRNDLIADDSSPSFTSFMSLGRGVRSRSGLWIPNGVYQHKEEDLVPVNLDFLGLTD